jgi:hypothetical protein
MFGKLRRCPTCLLPIVLILSTGSSAQQAADTFRINSSDVLTGIAREGLGANSLLFTGEEYIRNGTPASGFPFFLSDSILPGSVLYFGVFYARIGLEYDLVSDDLVIHDFSGNTYIKLVKSKVETFRLPGHSFRRLEPEKESGLKPGYYETVYTSAPLVNPGGAGAGRSDGSSAGNAAGRLGAKPISVFARHEKKLLLPSNQEDQPRYVASDVYYLEMDGRYNRVDDKGMLLDLFGDQKDLLKKFIRQNKLDFKRHFEASLIRTIDYYVQLKA